MTQIRCALAGFLSKHQGLWVNEAEGVDNDLSFDGLDGIDYHCYGSRGELFEGLLCVDIDRGEPAAESGM